MKLWILFFRSHPNYADRFYNILNDQSQSSTFRLTCSSCSCNCGASKNSSTLKNKQQSKNYNMKDLKMFLSDYERSAKFNHVVDHYLMTELKEKLRYQQRGLTDYYWAYRAQQATKRTRQPNRFRPLFDTWRRKTEMFISKDKIDDKTLLPTNNLLPA